MDVMDNNQVFKKALALLCLVFLANSLELSAALSPQEKDRLKLVGIVGVTAGFVCGILVTCAYGAKSISRAREEADDLREEKRIIAEEKKGLLAENQRLMNEQESHRKWKLKAERRKEKNEIIEQENAWLRNEFVRLWYGGDSYKPVYLKKYDGPLSTY